MKKPLIERRLSEKTKITLNIITIILVVGTIISGTLVYANSQNTLINGIEKTNNTDIIQNDRIEILENREREKQELLIQVTTKLEMIIDSLDEIKERIK